MLESTTTYSCLWSCLRYLPKISIYHQERQASPIQVIVKLESWAYPIWSHVIKRLLDDGNDVGYDEISYVLVPPDTSLSCNHTTPEWDGAKPSSLSILVWVPHHSYGSCEELLNQTSLAKGTDQGILTWPWLQRMSPHSKCVVTEKLP
jgi:hypothetical protein